MKRILVNSIKANMELVNHLLSQDNVLDRIIPVKSNWGDHYYYKTNPDNVELRQRIRLLRKELKNLEKEIMIESRKWGVVHETDIQE